MDFHALVRKDLQFLCKKNGIAANLTNVAMANALQALESVEGIEEIQEALGMQSPKKAGDNSSPDGPRIGRASSRRAIHGDGSKIKQSSSLPRQRLSTAKGLEEETKKKELTKVLPNTQSSRIRAKNEEEDEGSSETPKQVESRNRKAIGPITRRSTRFSSRNPLEETDTIQSISRRSTRAKATVNKMGALYRVDADELEKGDNLGEKGYSGVDLPDEADEKKDKEVESYDLSSSLDGEVAKVEVGNGDSSDVFDAENENLFVDVLGAEKGHSCLLTLDVEDVMKGQGESHVLPSPIDWVSSNVEVDKPLVVPTEDSLPLTATESLNDFHVEPLEKELMEDSRDQLLENKLVKDSGDFLSPRKQCVEVFSDLSQEETGSCVMGEKENLGLLEAGVSQVASELATEIPEEAEKSIDLATDSDIVSSSIMAFAKPSEQTSIKAFAKSSEQIVDQSNACEIATKFSETLSKIREDTIIHPAVSAALSSSDAKLSIDSAQLTLIQTQLLNSEEAVEKVEKRLEKENSVQDNLKNISLIKLRAMYKQKLDNKKNELGRANSMIKTEEAEIFGRIVLNEQKIENENIEKLERVKNSMIRQEDFEFCSSIKQKLGDKIKLERNPSAIKQSKLDSNWTQKLSEEDKIQSERKRTPLKNLN